ncbi:hypothetical protein D3C81_1939390 [compost metagenome]
MPFSQPAQRSCELVVPFGQQLEGLVVPVPLELAFAVSGEAWHILLLCKQPGDGRGQLGQQGGVALPAPAHMPEQPEIREERDHLLGRQDYQLHAIRVLQGQFRSIKRLFMPGEQLLLQLNTGNIVVPVVDGVD